MTNTLALARDNEIFARHLAGASNAKLAEAFDLHPGTIGNIVRERRAAVPAEAVDEIKSRTLAFLNDTTDRLMSIARLDGNPVVDNKGAIVYDPINGEVVRDFTQQIKAALAALSYLERLHKVAGADAPKQVNHTVSEATQEQAAKVIDGKFRHLAAVPGG